MKISFLNFNIKNNPIRLRASNVSHQNIEEKKNISSLNAKYFSYYTPAFCGYKKPVYLIYKNGGYARYDSGKEAGKAIGISANMVSGMVGDKRTSVKGARIVDANRIETTDENGSLTVDFDKIREIVRQLDTSIYVIRTTGEYEKFSDSKEAAESLGMDTREITSLVSGVRNKIKGITARKASEVEYEDEDKNPKADKLKISKIAQSINTDIFALSPEGILRRFQTETQAAHFLNTKPANISQALLSEGKITAKENYIVYASDIETMDEEGNIRIDRKKLTEIIKKDQSIYVIHKDGSFQKFNTQKEASLRLGVTQSAISQALKNPFSNINGAYLRYSKDITETDEHGNIFPDDEKILDIIGQKDESVYIINKNGEYKKFENKKQASKYLNTTLEELDSALNDNTKSIGDYIIKRSEAVETTDNNGETKADMKKIFLSLSRGDKSIYVIQKDGKYKKFKSQNAAAQYYNFSVKNLGVEFKSPVKSKGMLFVYAFDVEKEDENGKTVIDKEKLKKLLNKSGMELFFYFS